ncbi:TonB-dependent receptor [Thermoflexibacter ruber]|uniref:Iron complex outermembrane recepter protein n=1 Tax=Thermoflexibacter ruber TaxID=1003 RepID=A0A1I2FVH0_9BACT|nr:TonB-dependent receptor [Thermoflexibacter ruber]SFF08809.1 iron complex outermembrane recepter protein [Thermoflexibacter ruber]
MKNCYYILIFLILSAAPFLTLAQSIKGSIKDQNDKPVPALNIVLEGTGMGTITDTEGQFTITNIQAGKYKLVVSGIGYLSQRQNIVLKEGDELILNLVVTENITELQSVEIIGRKETTYKNESSFIATKTATALKDIPQSVSYVTKELIQDQQAIRTGEIIKNVSGVNQFSFYDDFTLRGFRSNVQLINGLRITSGFWKQPLTINLERMEVIKGPASALFGNTDPGGTINRVTKKPLDEKRQSLSFTTGSFQTFRALADFTGPMNEQKTLLYRLNLGYENAESFRNMQFNNNIVIAPSISFLPSEKTRINFDMVYNRSKSRLDRGQAVFGTGDLYSTPISFATGAVNDFLNEDNLFITASLNHKFSEKITFNTSYMKFAYAEDLLEHRTANRYAKDGTGRDIPTLLEMQVFLRQRKRFVDNLTTYFTIDFNTGKSVSHKLLVGYDYIQETVPLGGGFSVASGYRNAANTGIIGTFNPANARNYLLDSRGNPIPNVPHFDLASGNPYRIADISKYFFTQSVIVPSFYSINGFYLQDQIKIGKLQALIGLRQEYYNDLFSYKTADEQKIQQTALIPRIGLVYSLTQHINTYLTYVEGYNPQTASSIANPNAGGPFDPLTSKMIEVGAKGEFFDKMLSANLAIYQITQNNILINAGSPTNPDLLRQIGQERARGFEIDFIGRVLPNWSVVINYAYNNAIISKSSNESEIGNQKPNAPKHQGNFWTKYVIDRGKLEGLGFGLGGNFVDERVPSLNRGQRLPKYALLNAALYYSFNKFLISLNINNIGNKVHWVGGYDYIRLFPGAPRNFLATVAYTF